MQLIPESARSTIEGTAHSAVLTYSGRLKRRRRSSTDFVALVQRSRFDHALVEAAIESGATFAPGLQLRKIEGEVDGLVTLVLNDRQTPQIHARVVVGADGVNGACRRYVQVRPEYTDLALEAELQRSGNDSEWNEMIRIDWGRLRGAYTWVFPKGDRLTVGVIAEKNHNIDMRLYLEWWIKHLGLQDREVIRFSGHLTQVRRPDSPLRRGGVLVAGDAAGLLEPCSREGISFALRSGGLAGRSAAQASEAASPSDRETALNSYCRVVNDVLGREQQQGRLLRRMFERAPLLVHLVVGWSPWWSANVVKSVRRFVKSRLNSRQQLDGRGTRGDSMEQWPGAPQRFVP